MAIKPKKPAAVTKAKRDAEAEEPHVIKGVALNRDESRQTKGWNNHTESRQTKAWSNRNESRQTKGGGNFSG